MSGPRASISCTYLPSARSRPYVRRLGMSVLPAAPVPLQTKTRCAQGERAPAQGVCLHHVRKIHCTGTYLILHSTNAPTDTPNRMGHDRECIVRSACHPALSVRTSNPRPVLCRRASTRVVRWLVPDGHTSEFPVAGPRSRVGRASQTCVHWIPSLCDHIGRPGSWCLLVSVLV